MNEENTKKSKNESKDHEEKDSTKKTQKLNPNDKITAEEQIKILEDKLARAYAEMENQRRRYEKDKDDAFEYGGFSFAKETLNLLDNLDRSKNTLESDDALIDSSSLKKITEHIEIIKKDMISIFKKNNIEEISSINKKLDPNYHQAMMEVEDDSKEVGTIVQEIQKGFMMKDRLLRPALVAVSKKSDKQEKKEENDEKKVQN